MKKILSIILLITLIIIPQTGCNNEEPISKTDYCLDTVCQIDIYEGGDEALIDEAFKLCRHYENLLSKTVKTSDISMINRGGKVKVDEDTVEVLKKGLYYSKLSGGSFDITVGTITDLWDFHQEEPTVPKESALIEAIKHISYTNLTIDGNEVNLKDGKIDLGAIAKGYICDKVVEFLKSNGVTSCVVNLGGNIAVIGGKGKEPFKVGIERPYSDRSEIVGMVEARDMTLVTSGIYERCFQKDGKTYHHILDPKTGYPVNSDIESVTIISSLGKSVDCDGLSTLCLTLGVKEATKLIESIDGVEAVFIDRDDNITKTSGANFEEQ